MKGVRYLVRIEFKVTWESLNNRTSPILKSTKTLNEARSYKELIDNTVSSATVYDVVKERVIETWV